MMTRMASDLPVELFVPPRFGEAGQRYLKNHHQWVDVRAQQEDNFHEIISPKR